MRKSIEWGQARLVLLPLQERVLKLPDEHHGNSIGMWPCTGLQDHGTILSWMDVECS